MDKYKILVGGLGDDAHSIGSNLIKLALEEQGYIVSYIGIQNKIKDFLYYSNQHDIILVSCINGHSELYLNNDEYNLLLDQYKVNKLWYVGGNLSVNKSDDYIIDLYRRKGFNTVFPKPVSIEVLLEQLKRDIAYYNIHPRYSDTKKISYVELNQKDMQEILYEKKVKFEEERKLILASWKTGKDVSYEVAKQNHMGTVNMDKYLCNACTQNKTPVIQPRTGVAVQEKQYQLLKTLSENGIGIASIQLDAASRRKDFNKALEGIERSIGNDVSALNGYPVPVYGVKGVFDLSHKINLPFQIRGGANDHRFVYEVALAGGASGLEGGFLSYLLPYDKLVSPFQSLENWRYVDQLCAKYYQLFNIRINREFFGPLTTTLIEPSIPIVINIIGALSAVKQGVKSISIGIAEQGCRNQDIAAVCMLDYFVKFYLKKYGYHDINVTTVYHQYMGAFPYDEVKAEKLIEQSTITATLANATRIMTKTPVEAIKIPDKFDNIRGIQITQKGIKKAQDVKLDHAGIEKEKLIIQAEVTSIMNMVEILGGNSIEIGAIKALQKGIIDIPFSPNVYNCGKAIGFRNINGAIRLAQIDNLPFPSWVKELHLDDLRKRKNEERDEKIYSIIEKDLTRISKGEYKAWPLERY